MNPTLKAKLDEIVNKLSDSFCTRLYNEQNIGDSVISIDKLKPLINIMVQVNLAVAKLGVVSMYATSKHINVKASVELLNNDVSNIIIVAAALAGFEEDETDKVMTLYKEVNKEVMPLLHVNYGAAGNEISRSS